MGPRYCPERSLPDKAYVPGRTPHSQKPADDAHAVQWDGSETTLARTSEFCWGVDLFNHGYYWEAHEAWEALWMCATPGSASRDFLQGLIQCAAACLKASLQRWPACQALTQKALARLSRVIELAGDRFLGLDVRQFAADFIRSVDENSSELHAPRLDAPTWGSEP